jgi:UDPglucose--hexose-1-phosphate uridylyltransferase
VPELRRDPLTGRTVVVATRRGTRPKVFTGAPATPPSSPPDDCPFCPGHESMTPPEVDRTGEGAPETAGWRVRVVPNLYPIVGGEDAAPGATGAHEVVVLSPRHDCTFARLAPDQAIEVMTVLRDRTRALLAAGHAYVQVFVNQGRAAGASIEHPHAQIVALDFVPPAVEDALARVIGAGHDLVVAAAGSARESGRIVVDGDAVAWCAYAPAAPYEVAIAHTGAGARFAAASDDQLAAVSPVLQSVLARIAGVAGDPPYNVVFHAAPGLADMADARWWIEVSPRLSLQAGFEMGTGVLVATMPPETAAATLRDAGEARAR